MRPVRALTAYFVAVLLGGALAAPWVYALAQLAGKRFAAVESLAHQPLHRYVHRCWLALAVIGLVPLLRRMGVRSSRDLGLTQPRGEWRKWGWGFLLGFVSLALVTVIALMSGAREWQADLTATELGRHLANATLAALGVSILEEIFFRGVLFGMLRRVYHWPAALLVSSAVYALVHFFRSVELAGPVGWLSGMELLPGMLHGLVDLKALLPGFASLTLAGLALGLAYQRTDNLYFSFGLHAGWIFWLKSYGRVTRPARAGGEWFWGTNQLTDGWLALILLSLVLIVVLRFLPAQDAAKQGT